MHVERARPDVARHVVDRCQHLVGRCRGPRQHDGHGGDGHEVVAGSGSQQAQRNGPARSRIGRGGGQFDVRGVNDDHEIAVALDEALDAGVRRGAAVIDHLLAGGQAVRRGEGDLIVEPDLSARVRVLSHEDVHAGGIKRDGLRGQQRRDALRRPAAQRRLRHGNPSAGVGIGVGESDGRGVDHDHVVGLSVHQAGDLPSALRVVDDRLASGQVARRRGERLSGTVAEIVVGDRRPERTGGPRGADARDRDDAGEGVDRRIVARGDAQRAGSLDLVRTGRGIHVGNIRDRGQHGIVDPVQCDRPGPGDALATAAADCQRRDLGVEARRQIGRLGEGGVDRDVAVVGADGRPAHGRRHVVADVVDGKRQAHRRRALRIGDDVTGQCGDRGRVAGLDRDRAGGPDLAGDVGRIRPDVGIDGVGDLVGRDRATEGETTRPTRPRTADRQIEEPRLLGRIHAERARGRPNRRPVDRRRDPVADVDDAGRQGDRERPLGRGGDRTDADVDLRGIGGHDVDRPGRGHLHGAAPRARCAGVRDRGGHVRPYIVEPEGAGTGPVLPARAGRRDARHLPVHLARQIDVEARDRHALRLDQERMARAAAAARQHQCPRYVGQRIHRRPGELHVRGIDFDDVIRRAVVQAADRGVGVGPLAIDHGVAGVQAGGIDGDLVLVGIRQPHRGRGECQRCRCNGRHPVPASRAGRRQGDYHRQARDGIRTRCREPDVRRIDDDDVVRRAREQATDGGIGVGALVVHDLLTGGQPVFRGKRDLVGVDRVGRGVERLLPREVDARDALITRGALGGQVDRGAGHGIFPAGRELDRAGIEDDGMVDPPIDQLCDGRARSAAIHDLVARRESVWIRECHAVAGDLHGRRGVECLRHRECRAVGGDHAGVVKAGRYGHASRAGIHLRIVHVGGDAAAGRRAIRADGRHARPGHRAVVERDHVGVGEVDAAAHVVVRHRCANRRAVLGAGARERQRHQGRRLDGPHGHVGLRGERRVVGVGIDRVGDRIDHE